jgi:hypothetical protein
MPVLLGPGGLYEGLRARVAYARKITPIMSALPNAAALLCGGSQFRLGQNLGHSGQDDHHPGQTQVE